MTTAEAFQGKNPALITRFTLLNVRIGFNDETLADVGILETLNAGYEAHAYFEDGVERNEVVFRFRMRQVDSRQWNACMARRRGIFTIDWTTAMGQLTVRGDGVANYSLYTEQDEIAYIDCEIGLHVTHEEMLKLGGSRKQEGGVIPKHTGEYILTREQIEKRSATEATRKFRAQILAFNTAVKEFGFEEAIKRCNIGVGMPACERSSRADEMLSRI